MLSMGLFHLPLSILTQRTDLHDIWQERHTIGGRPKRITFNFLQLIITTWRTLELVSWKRH